MVDKTRVLVVDDSVVIRRLLTKALERADDIEVVGTAADGRIALAKLQQLNPDVVTLDIEMPVLDGLDTLVELRRDYPHLPVIMCSTLTERGASATIEALSRGASDYVAKPSKSASASAALLDVSDQLVAKIRSLHRRERTNTARPSVQSTIPRPVLPKPRVKTGAMPSVLLIGSSTGGPQALVSVLSELPADFPLPVAVVQHMPPIFTAHLATRLNQVSKLSVKEAAEGDVFREGEVLIAPGDFHLTMQRKGTQVLAKLNQAPPENSCRPAVDVLFRSGAEVFGGGVMAVVLTGMGRDGLRGAEAISQAGGETIVQNEATCVVWGMPRAVYEAGVASECLALTDIPRALMRRVSARC